MHHGPTRFEGRDDAPAWHRRYRPIEVVQGFTQSHWTTWSGNYLLGIPPDGQWGLCQKKMTKKYHTCWPFCWPWQCVGTVSSTLPDRRGRLSQKPLVAVIGRVLQPIHEIGQAFEGFLRVFTWLICWKASWVDVKAPNSIGEWHINWPPEGVIWSLWTLAEEG